MAHFFTEKKQLMYMILLLLIALMFVCPTAYAQQTPLTTSAPAADSSAGASEYIVSQNSNSSDENTHTENASAKHENANDASVLTASETGESKTDMQQPAQGAARQTAEESSGAQGGEDVPKPTDAPPQTPVPTQESMPTDAPAVTPQPAATDVPSPQVRFSRDFSGRYAEYGSYVTLSYTVRNDGALPVTDITVRDGLLGKIGGIDELDPGEKKTFSARVKVTETCISSPSISYKYAGIGHTRYCSEKTIYLADVNVLAEIEADKTNVTPGEYVTLRLRISNEGNVNLYSLRIQEPMLGEIGSGTRSLAPGEEYVVTRTVQMKSTAAFHFQISGSSDTGEAFSMEAEEIGVIVMPAAAQIKMQLSAQADQTQLEAPDEVTFSLRLDNECMLELRDVVLSENTLGEIRRLEFVPSGEMPVITHTCYISESGTYTFKAQVVDAVGDRVTVYSDPVHISVRGEQAQHSERPVPAQTEAAQELIEVPEGSPYRMAEEVATFEKLIVWTVLMLIGVLFLWYIVSNVRRFFRRRRRKRNKKKNKVKVGAKKTGGKGR